MPPPLPFASNVLARRSSDQQIEFSADAVRIHIELNNLQTQDGHDLRAAMDCSVRVAENASDRQLLGEILLNGKQSLHGDAIASHLAENMHRPIASFVANRSAQSFVSGVDHEALLNAMRSAADSAAFACGLIVLPPYALAAESATLQRAKLEQMQRVRAESRQAEQVEHLQRAGELLRQFHALREGSSTFGPGEILQRIAPADRGSTLEALLLASGRSSAGSQLWAVSGPVILKIDAVADPAGASPKVSSIDLPTELGPLRSVQKARIDGKSCLLIGARLGVFAFDSEQSPESAKAFTAPRAMSSNLGFNSVIFDDNTRAIWASHKGSGLTCWSFDTGELLDQPSENPGGRNAHLRSPGSVGYTVGPMLCVARQGQSIVSQGEAASAAAVVAVVKDASRMFLIHEDGIIATRDLTGAETIDRQARPGHFCAAAALPWLASIRLLLAREAGPIDCIGPDDQLVTQYLSAHGGYKMVAADVETVAAVSSDRQRIILWHAWDGRRPFAEIHVTSQTRHRIADIEFG